MRNNELLPYDTIVQATSGEPEAVNTVLQYYGRRIRYASRISGQADKEAEDFITETLLKALFKFRFIKAMENCGFHAKDIHQVLVELYEVFDFCAVEEAAHYYENWQY